MKIGLFYGSSTCYTEIIAEQIRDNLKHHTVDLHNLADSSVSEMAQYQHLIFGISTWDFGELQEDWQAVWSDLPNINFAHKSIALYGLGDQFGYSEWFLDAMGMLYQHIEQLTAGQVNWCGFWPNQGYEFISSKALSADNQHFVGLAIDEVNQYDLTQQRVEQWCQQVEQAFLVLE